MKLLSSFLLIALVTLLATPAVIVYAVDPPATTPPAASSGGFIGLTSIPAFEGVSASTGIASFLNNIYKIAIGVAAVLAVLQITRAGIEYMGGDSITEKRHARHLLLMSLLGLLLVLSPAIVFGIIDPRILNLNVGVAALQPSTQTTSTAQQSCVIDGQTFPPIQSGATVSSDAQKTCCTNQGFHLVPVGHSSTSFTCQQNAPTVNPRTQPGATGQETISGTVYHYNNLPADTGSYSLLFTKTNTAQTPACLALAFKAFPDQASCTAAVAGAQESHAGWSVGANCTVNLTNYLSIQSQTPICSPVESLP